MKGIILAVLLIVPGIAFCAQPSVSDLSAQLSNLRETCSKQASTSSEANAEAEYKSALDMKIAQSKAETDAQVYAVGHGRKETRDYLLDQYQAADQASKEESDAIAKKGKDDASAVQVCVADAEQKGKALYSDFKRSSKRAPHAADDLMTAWLANISEISFDKPTGTSETAAAWKTAKAHAELASL